MRWVRTTNHKDIGTLYLIFALVMLFVGGLMALVILMGVAGAGAGVLGLWYPWLVKSEFLHYAYALVMLVGFWLLRTGFTGRSKPWWALTLAIQFWHHFEHLLLQGQALFHHNLFGSPVPSER